MNFEAFQDLVVRTVRAWHVMAKRRIVDYEKVQAYLRESPMTAKQTRDNEEAYEQLIDARMQLTDLCYEIDRNHDAYMEFMQQTLESPALVKRLEAELPDIEEKHLLHLEMMVMEQVADWEIDIGKVEQSTGWQTTRRLVVHVPDGSTRTISVSQTPDKRYWFGLCCVSSKIGGMKQCGGCHVVGYIGKEEQKQDWPQHKALCKVLQAARAGADLWTSKMAPDELLRQLREGLDRAPTQFELDIAHHPRVCLVCKSGEQQGKLRDCKGCYCAAFCPDHHEDGMLKHAPDCERLHTAIVDYRNEVTVGHQVQNYLPRAETKYERLPETIETFFSADVASLVSNKLSGYQDSELRYLTFLYSCPLTVLYGMEMSDPALATRETLVIHLVGVRRAEVRHLTGWEILACRLPQLKSLHLFFVGDESPAKEMPRTFSYIGKELEARRDRLEVSYHFEPPQLYQDFAKRSSFMKPDFIAVLDCGFKFYPSWRPAIAEFLHQEGATVIFTEFTLADQRDNLALVQSVGGVTVLVEPAENPFRSMRPVRCSDSDGNYKDQAVIYTNDYICAVKSKRA